jgi:PAS domain S-box-containing protein
MCRWRLIYLAAFFAGLAICTALVLWGVPASGLLPFFFLAISAILIMDTPLGIVAGILPVLVCVGLLRFDPPNHRPVPLVNLLSVTLWFLGTNALVWGLTWRLRTRVHQATRQAENVLPLPHAPHPGPAHLYARLVDLAPDGVVVVDSAGYIVLWSQQAVAMFGYSRDEILGEPVEILVPEDVRTQHQAQRLAYMQAPRLLTLGAVPEQRGRRKDGSEFPCEISLSPVETTQGGISTVLVKASVRDITERKARDEELIATRVKQRSAEDALKERDEMLAIAAHELKTPITSISGFAELLAQTIASAPVPLPSPQRERLEHALAFLSSQTARLAKLIEQLLDLSRLQTNRFIIHKEEIDIVALCSDTISITQVTHTQPILLDTNTHTLIVYADSVRMSQVLSNLLANAIKYAPDSPIIVRVRREERQVRLSVIDRGPGVPEEKRAWLFTRFTQAHNGQQSGLGLGLFLAREIIYLHAGEIWAEFPSDGGMTVHIILPLEDKIPPPKS